MTTPYLVPLLFVAAIAITIVNLASPTLAQFVAPPPAKAWGVPAEAATTQNEFTEQDRKMLRSINAYTRSIRAKLFPYQEEQNILELRQ